MVSGDDEGGHVGLKEAAPEESEGGFGREAGGCGRNGSRTESEPEAAGGKRDGEGGEHEDRTGGNAGGRRLGGLSRGLFARVKLGDVGAFGDDDDFGFKAAFVGEVTFQFQAKLARLGADDVVFAGVIVWRAAEDLYADLLLGGGFGFVAESALCNIEEKRAEAGAFLERGAGNNPLHEEPARIQW